MVMNLFWVVGKLDFLDTTYPVILIPKKSYEVENKRSHFIDDNGHKLSPLFKIDGGWWRNM